MPNILFRADAEESIGVGDLMSVIYLSGEFRKNSWKCFFVVRDYTPALQIIKLCRLKDVQLLPSNISVQEEIDFIKKICRDNAIDCLFMEITKNKLYEYNQLGKPAPIKICVNFDGDITEDFDVVVNWCIDSSDDLYEHYKDKNNNIEFIFGFENTILPDYFDWEKISNKKFNKEIKKILISMGGVDKTDLTGKIVRALSQVFSDYEIRVIIGPGYAKQKALSQVIGKDRRFSLKQHEDKMFDDYMWADIAFSAGGLTSSELVATKTPAVLVATYEHQIKRCEYYAKKRWAHYLGYYSGLDQRKIIQSLNYLSDNLDLFQDSLYHSVFRGGNEKIFKSVDSRRQFK